MGDGVVPSGNAQGGKVGEQHGPPGPMPSHDAFEQDPLINAGKAVWSGMRGLFSAVKGGGGDSDSRVPQGGQKDNQAESGFYFDKEKNMWRQRGSNDDADAGEYDYMTGQKLTPTVSESPAAAPPPPPPMGAPPPVDVQWECQPPVPLEPTATQHHSMSTHLHQLVLVVPCMHPHPWRLDHPERHLSPTVRDLLRHPLEPRNKWYLEELHLCLLHHHLAISNKLQV